MKKNKIAALVPMRHHSQRVPGKNYRNLAGKPLFHYILESLIACDPISEILVDTDSEIILKGIESNFPGVKGLMRPLSLRGDDVPMNEILLYDTQQISADFFLQTHSTNPFLSSATITQAIKMFIKNYPKYDSMFSVSRLQTRLWNSLTQPINHDPNILLQTQDLPPVYEENSCLYIFTPDKLEKRKNRIGEKPLMYEMPVSEALDIDDENDFLIAELLMKHLKES